MYKLTPRMEQHFCRYLAEYHNLFDGGRCSGWELEELIVKSIRADNNVNHQPIWIEGGHDDNADIKVTVNRVTYEIQIKSGAVKARDEVLWLSLSGHRLGRFNGDLDMITTYLNNRMADVISVPYRKDDGNHGRQHIYRLCYIPITLLKGINSNNWCRHGAQWRNHNDYGVEFSLRPSMSWQIWWKIPFNILDLNLFVYLVPDMTTKRTHGNDQKGCGPLVMGEKPRTNITPPPLFLSH